MIAEARTQSIQRTLTSKKGPLVCFAAAAVKTWDGARNTTTGVCDERPVLVQPTGSTTTPMYPSHEAASVEIGQSSADDGTALAEEHDQHAKRAPHIKPKRVDEAQSVVEQLGVARE